MDPVTIALIASTVMAAINGAVQMIQIATNPASTPEAKAAAVKAGNDIIASLSASGGLNDQWKALAPQ